MESILFSILKIALLIIAVIMTFFILLQEGKGGGLSALGGTKAAGVEGVTNPIRRATAYLAFLFFLLAIVLGIMANKSGTITNDEIFKNQGAGPKGPGNAAPQEPPPMDFHPGGPGMVPPMNINPTAPMGGAEAVVEIPPKTVEKPATKTESDPSAKSGTGAESKTAEKLEGKTGAPPEAKTESAPALKESDVKSAAPTPPASAPK